MLNYAAVVLVSALFVLVVNDVCGAAAAAAATTSGDDQVSEQLREQPQIPTFKNLFDPQVSLTVNPRTRQLQIYWSNKNVQRGDRILITDSDPGDQKFERYEVVNNEFPTTTTDSSLPTTTTEDFITSLYSLDKFLGIGAFDSTEGSTDDPPVEPPKFLWKFGDPPENVVYSMMIQEPQGWWKTNVAFDNEILKTLNKDSKCFGFWVHMIHGNGTVITRNCLKAHPKWMNELREEIKDVKMRHLFIPGSHNSGSYKNTFTENRLTKYAICQDNDIRSQLMQGIRYLDLRVGHYRKMEHAFYIVHSVVRFQPLIEVLNAVKDFVEETNEIVILDFQEFPVGFQPDEMIVHRKLVQFIYDQMKDHLIQPVGTWDVSLNDLWAKKGNVIIGYDKPSVHFEYKEMLWQSVEHMWPNKADIGGLLKYLNNTREFMSTNYRMRPIAEMAELTAKAIDVITDRFGGLRKMSLSTNRVISELYSSEFGLEANVVAVDFHMSSTIVETALKFNKMKRENASSRN